MNIVPIINYFNSSKQVIYNYGFKKNQTVQKVYNDE